MSRRKRLAGICLDCGIDTITFEEYYMVSDEAWAATGVAKHGGMLCRSCLSRRLGRKLVLAEFTALVPGAEAWKRYCRLK